MLAGPHQLHDDLPTKLGEINAFRKQFTDAQLEKDRDAFPPVRRKKPPRKGRASVEIPGRLSQLLTAGLAPIRQLRPARELAEEFPEAELTAMDARWYRLAGYDSAIVSMNDGTSAAFYQRDPAKYRELLRKTLEIHERFRREWPRLAEEYRAALPEVTSPEAWERTFAPYTEMVGTREPDAHEREGRDSARPRARAAGGAVGDQRAARGVPAPLPAAADGAARDPGALRAVAVRARVVLHQPDGAVLHVLLRLRDPARARQHPELRRSTCSRAWCWSTTSPRR